MSVHRLREVDRGRDLVRVACSPVAYSYRALPHLGEFATAWESGVTCPDCLERPAAWPVKGA